MLVANSVAKSVNESRVNGSKHALVGYIILEQNKTDLSNALASRHFKVQITWT